MPYSNLSFVPSALLNHLRRWADLSFAMPIKCCTSSGELSGKTCSSDVPPRSSCCLAYSRSSGVTSATKSANDWTWTQHEIRTMTFTKKVINWWMDSNLIQIISILLEISKRFRCINEIAPRWHCRDLPDRDFLHGCYVRRDFYVLDLVMHDL